MASSYRVEDRPDGRYWTLDNSRPVAADTRHASERRLEPMTTREELMRAAGMGVVGAVAAVSIDFGLVLLGALAVLSLGLSLPLAAVGVMLGLPWFLAPYMFIGAYREHHDLTLDFYQAQNAYMFGLHTAIDALPDAPAAEPVTRIITPAPMTADDRQRDRLLAVAAYALKHGDAAVPKRGPGRNGRPDVTCANSHETLDEQAYMDTASILVRLGIFSGGNGKPYALAAKWQGAAFDDIADVIESAVV